MDRRHRPRAAERLAEFSVCERGDEVGRNAASFDGSGSPAVANSTTPQRPLSARNIMAERNAEYRPRRDRKAVPVGLVARLR